MAYGPNRINGRGAEERAARKYALPKYGRSADGRPSEQHINKTANRRQKGPGLTILFGKGEEDRLKRRPDLLL
eukprot:3808024-Lingulodinium_polyedra.AAC.1